MAETDAMMRKCHAPVSETLASLPFGALLTSVRQMAGGRRTLAETGLHTDLPSQYSHNKRTGKISSPF